MPLEDNGEGTLFSNARTTYVIERSIFIKKYESQGVSAYYFSSHGIGTEPDLIQIESDINFNIPSGELLPGCTDECIGIYDFAIIAPTTGQFSFSIECDGRAELKFHEAIYAYTCTGSGSRSENEPFRKDLEEGKAYFGYITYTKYSFTATVELSLFWDYPGQSDQIVPASAFLHASSTGISRNFTGI